MGEAVKIFLASDSSGIHEMWPNRENVVLEHQPKDVVALFSISHNHFAHGGST